MTINTIDTTTPLVGLKAGAEVYNANFTDSNNAASKEVGTLSDQVPTNANLGTASLVDTGTAAGNVPTNGDLGTASTKDTGTSSGQIPLNSDLGTASTKDVQSSPSDATAGAVLNNETTHIGGEINYTGSNFQPNESNGIGTARILYATSSSVAIDAIVSGSLVSFAFVQSDGTYQKFGSLSSGQTWKNVGGGTATSSAPMIFTRIS